MFDLICFQNPLPVPEFVCKTKTVLQIRFEHPLHPLGHSEPQGHELEHSALSRLQLDTQVVSPSQALRHSPRLISQIELHRFTRFCSLGARLLNTYEKSLTG